MSIFFKYSTNIFSQNFAVRKSVKRKFIPVLLSWYFFHYVNDSYTMRYYYYIIMIMIMIIIIIIIVIIIIIIIIIIRGIISIISEILSESRKIEI